MQRRLAFAPQVCLVLFAAFAAACGSGSINGGNQPDASTGNCNGGVCDAPIRFDARPLGCADPGGTPCKIGQTCYQDRCYTDTCVAQGDAGAACPAGEACTAACIPQTDPCTGVTCGVNETCFQGRCSPGCFSPSACIGKTCGTDEFCQNGTCQKINPCDLPCPTGQVCNAACHIPGPCDDVVCPQPNQTCLPGPGPDGGLQGTCVTDLCYMVKCDPGKVCRNGTCVDTCAGECPCTLPAICVQNKCINKCVPSCDGKHCGQDDGCGNKCRVQDCGTGMTCNSDEMCVCDPSCSGKQCGELNACGDKCNVPCGGNETCDPNQGCVCNNATCGDNCCAGGQTCVDGACCGGGATCDPGAPVACCPSGQTCEPQGGTKQLCCAGSAYCPFSETCCGSDNPVCGKNNTTMQDQCCPTGNSYCSVDNSCCSADQKCFETPAHAKQCCSGDGNYCSATGECCDAKGAGWHCDGSESNCCAPGKNGQYCPKLEGGAGCCANSNEKCRDEPNGTDQLCCTDQAWCIKKEVCCTTDSTGRALSNPKCFNNDANGSADDDTCCNVGEVPNSDGTCCRPSCTGAVCGASDGCGGFCTGTCGTPGTSCKNVDPGGYQCVPDVCNVTCGCDEYCVNNTCQPLCAPGLTVCGCSVCCSLGCDDSDPTKCKVNG